MCGLNQVLCILAPKKVLNSCEVTVVLKNIIENMFLWHLILKINNQRYHLVLDINDPPRIFSASDTSPLPSLDRHIGTNNSERGVNIFFLPLRT